MGQIHSVRHVLRGDTPVQDRDGTARELEGEGARQFCRHKQFAQRRFNDYGSRSLQQSECYFTTIPSGQGLFKHEFYTTDGNDQRNVR